MAVLYEHESQRSAVTVLVCVMGGWTFNQGKARQVYLYSTFHTHW